jgi:N,N-dimethylformamidase
MTLTGYTDRLSYGPGETISCMLSSTAPVVSLDVVRLLHGDTNPRGPGHKSERIDAVPAQQVPAAVQQTYLGSCVVVPELGEPEIVGLQVEALVQPTLPEAGRRQGILTLVAADGAPILGVELTETGTVGLRDQDDRLLCEIETVWRSGSWHRVVVTVGTAGVDLRVETEASFGVIATSSHAGASLPTSLGTAHGLVVGAGACPQVDGQWRPVRGFSGKIERPRISRAAGAGEGDEVVGDWRFELSPESSECVDTSGRERHGIVVNAPLRAATGRSWDGSVTDFTLAAEQFGAIHFHEDDLDDAGWSTSTTVTTPTDLASGVYAVRIQGDGEVDHIPFVVHPSAAGPHARTAVLLPTFTYIAYGNERMIDRLDFEGEQMTDHPVLPGRHDRLLAEHPEWGLSLYDLHSDGSTCVHSTSRRPIPNLRPDYRAWLQNAPRHLAADLYLVDWLTEKGEAFDVITDHDLAESGPDLLSPYDLVITGSHPEYVSSTMLDSLEHLVEAGGSLMYLGGNGFYWVTSQDPQRPHLVEVRRGPVGTRPSDGEPGEGVHSTTGEPGGLWRHRGRGPNRLTGVGMTAQGWDEKAPGYARMPDSALPEAAFAFEGIDPDEIIGDFGLIMDGASGDEIDRFDLELGSPPETLVLARSTGHSDYYQLAGEDVKASRPGLGGTESPEVRSDMTLWNHPSGGSVFSVGSICFTGALSHDNYENNVSTLIANVMREFLRQGR